MDKLRRVKRAALIFSIFLFAAAPVTYAEKEKVGFSTFIDASWVFPVGLAFHPGVEFTFYSHDPGGSMVFDFGAALTGQVAFANRKDPTSPLEDLWSFTTFGISAAPIAILSFDDDRDDTTRFIERLDFSFSPGVGVNFYIYDGDPAYYANRDTFIVDLSLIAGARFSLSRFAAIRLDAMYWGQYIGPNIAVGLQLDLW